MPARLEINLANLKHNVNCFKERILKNQELLVMVKADAYGAGIVEVTKYLEKNGVKHFGVAYLKEAKKLRANNIQGEITVFSGLVPNEIQEAIDVDAIYSVSDFVTLEKLNKEAKKKNKKVKIEVAIDTGMTRLGFNQKDIYRLSQDIKELTNIEIHGVYSHLSQADYSDSFTKMQIENFDECVEILKENGAEPKYVHLLNSAGILKYNSDKYNLVRLGISAYGYLPSQDIQSSLELKGIFKLTAPICSLRYVNEGRQVSYGGTFKTTKATKIAVLQIGYADGLTRTLSNNYEVDAKGVSCKIIGNICMDTCMIDVTDACVELGDEVIVFGFEDDKITTLADNTNTIVYEVITNIGKRVDRVYIDN